MKKIIATTIPHNTHELSQGSYSTLAKIVGLSSAAVVLYLVLGGSSQSDQCEYSGVTIPVVCSQLVNALGLILFGAAQELPQESVPEESVTRPIQRIMEIG